MPPLFWMERMHAFVQRAGIESMNLKSKDHDGKWARCLGILLLGLCDPPTALHRGWRRSFISTRCFEVFWNAIVGSIILLLIKGLLIAAKAASDCRCSVARLFYGEYGAHWEHLLVCFIPIVRIAIVVFLSLISLFSGAMITFLLVFSSWLLRCDSILHLMNECSTENWKPTWPEIVIYVFLVCVGKKDFVKFQLPCRIHSLILFWYYIFSITDPSFSWCNEEPRPLLPFLRTSWLCT